LHQRVQFHANVTTHGILSYTITLVFSTAAATVEYQLLVSSLPVSSDIRHQWVHQIS